jgi:uncharacterized protein YgiM (DUF1202 family)
MKKITFALLIFILCLACTNRKTAGNESADDASNIPAVVETEIILPEEEIVYVSPSRGINLRSGPSTADSRIKHLQQNAKLTILEKSGQRERIDGLLDYWYKVDTGNETGWVFGGYVTNVPRSRNVELKKVNEYEIGSERWGSGIRETDYSFTLVDNQALCRDFLSSSIAGKPQHYLKNYLTGEVTYHFEGSIELWGGGNPRNFIIDQYGHYIFLDKGGTIVLFDVQEKREIQPGEPLKRPEYVYYTERRRNPTGRGNTSYIVKYNLTTGQSTDLNNENLKFKNSVRENSYFDLDILYDGYYRTLKDIGNNQLLLYNDFFEWIIQLDESMTEVLSTTEKEKISADVTYLLLRMNNGKYIGFADNRDVLMYDADSIIRVYTQLLDETRSIESEYRDIVLTFGTGFGQKNMPRRCHVSPDNQYVLFLDQTGKTLSSHNVYVYQILYD